jgi:hypothetical protein
LDAVSPENARRLVQLIREFGFETPDLSEKLFLTRGRMIRMGVEPTRIELLTEISGREFSAAYEHRIESTIDGIPVKVIGRDDLIANKLKSGRLKDLLDVQKLSR